MRVVGGKYRGKKLKEFNLTSTKPTLDKVKEAIFDMLQTKIYGAHVLDLFSGTGAFGVEALSRGAAFVDFVDNNSEAIKLINANLTGIEGEFKVTNADYLQFLTGKSKYDAILLDPPYLSDCGVKAIHYILSNNMLNENGVIVLETLNEGDVNLKQIFGVDEPSKKPIIVNYRNKNYTVTKRKYGTVKVYKIEL